MLTNTSSLLLLLASLATSVISLPAGSACPNGPAKGALYLISNTKSNAVVSLRINNDGTVANGRTTSTGGAGSNAVEGAEMKAAAPDALVSQSALTVTKDVSKLHLYTDVDY